MSRRSGRNREIMKFISLFEKAKDIFLNGCCYWFAYILSERFAGDIYYNPIDNHFAAKIGNGLYDASGEIDQDEFVTWESYRRQEPIECARIVKQCILKEGEGDI